MAFKLVPSSTYLSFQAKKFTISALTAALAVAGFSSYALAQNSATDTLHVIATPLNTEVIAVAEQVDVIDAQTPEQQSATSALDLLKGQPGVFVSGSGSTYGQGIQMRGYDSRGVKITIDNVTQDFNSGLYNATFIDPSLIKKVYIHKGSVSVNHGGGALAGVVSFKTLNASDLLATDQNLGGHLFSGINRNDHSYHAGATLLARSGSFDALLSYSQRKKQLVATPESSSLDNHEKINNWMLKTSWFAHPSYRLAFQLREYCNDSISLKQPTVFDTRQPKFKNTPHERYSHQQDFLLSQHFSPSNNLNWQADWDIYYTNLSLSQLDLVKVTSTKKADRDYGIEKRNQYAYGTKFSNSFMIPMHGWVNHHIQSGLEYYQQEQKPNQHTTSYPPAELSNTSGWLTNDMTLHQLPITFSAGTRFTRYQTSRKDLAKDKYINWSSRFAVSATPTHWLNIYSSYSEGYRTPRMSELYNDSNHFSAMGGFLISDFRPSPDLQPETNKTIETGVKISFDDIALAGDSLQFGTTYFNTKAQNHIVLEGDYRDFGSKGWFPAKLYYVNIPSASIHGLDSFINYKTHWFSLNISHNQTVGEEDDTHYSLSSVRPETLLVRVNAPITTTGISVGWTGEFAAKTKFEGNSTYQLPKHTSVKGLDRYHKEVVQYAGYSLHDFYVNYQADQFVKGLSSTLTMKNAFDKQYVSSMGVPQEGRNFYFNVNYKW
ncbi:TonB-dependent receptor domain-containing protein [Providencia heimbachae]|uniref:TonB-dependent receptor domain-containing protein n=2 Tax=Providencia heimbachae TaxID=333962 RepID=UPI000839986F|nr:TonB-dependent receptor [Providencia heimbachae]NIH22998.1 TonB-dependent receptor [Providencia heimbachae]